MNGTRAKQIALLAGYKRKKERNLTLDKLYYTKEHIKMIGKVKFVSLQAFCRGDRALYKFYKNAYKKGER